MMNSFGPTAETREYKTKFGRDTLDENILVI